MTDSLTERLERLAKRLHAEQSQQDLEDRAQRAEAASKGIEEFCGRAVELAMEATRCLKQIPSGSRPGLTNWQRLRENLSHLRETVAQVPEKAETVFASNYSRPSSGAKRTPQIVDHLDSALSTVWQEYVQHDTGAIRATLELVALVPDWARHSAEAKPIIDNLSAWERRRPKAEKEFATYREQREQAQEALKKFGKLLPQEEQRQFLKRLQAGEATLSEAAKLMDWLEKVGLSEQLRVQLRPKASEPAPRFPSTRPARSRW